MKSLLSHMRNLDEITFGGERNDIFVEYDIEIPCEVKSLLDKIVCSISNYLLELRSNEFNWFMDQDLEKMGYNGNELSKFLGNTDNIENELSNFVENTNSIEEMKIKIRENISICGGFISDLAMNKELDTDIKSKDIDIFITQHLVDVIAFVKILKKHKALEDKDYILDEYYCNFSSKKYEEYVHEEIVRLIEFIDVLDLEEGDYRKVDDMDESGFGTYRSFEDVKGVVNVDINGLNVDFISKKSNNIEDIVLKFDFSFRKFYFNGEIVKASKGALYDLKNKTLHVNYPAHSLSTLFRGFEFQRKYDFSFNDFNKKILMYVYLKDEVLTTKSYNFVFGVNVFDKKTLLSNIENTIHSFENEDKKYEVELDLLQYISYSVMNNTFNSQKDFLEEVLLKKITTFDKYDKKYEKEIRKLIDWFVCVNIDMLTDIIETIERNSLAQIHRQGVDKLKGIGEEVLNNYNKYFLKEKSLFECVSYQFKERIYPMMYYSKILDYYLENDIQKYSYFTKDFKVESDGIPKYIYNKDKITVSGKEYSTNEILAIRNKLRTVLNFSDKQYFNDDNSYVIKVCDVLENLGIRFKKKEVFQQNFIDQTEIIKFLTTIDILFQKNQGLTNDKMAKNNFLSPDNLESFYTEKFSLHTNLGLGELIGNEKIVIDIRDHGLSGSSHFIGMLFLNRKNWKIEYQIKHPMTNFIDDENFSIYINEYKDKLMEKVNDIWIKEVEKEEGKEFKLEESEEELGITTLTF